MSSGESHEAVNEEQSKKTSTLLTKKLSSGAQV